MKSKSKIALICFISAFLFLSAFEWPTSFSYIPKNKRINEQQVKTANDTPIEGITNGGFETGNLTGWVTGGDHLAWVNTGAYNVHSGTYGCQISVYGGGHYNDAYVEQNLTDSRIYSDFVESFSFWHHVDRVVRVTVTYWDDTTTNHDFTGPFSWTQYYVTGLTPGKRLKRVRIATITDGVNYGGIDDVTLTYLPVYTTEGISNGGFETGDLTDWVTGGDHLAWVNTGAYNVHSGTYGCQISVYGGGHYNDAYVEQNLTNSIIYSDFVESFSFWHHVDRVVRVTVTYWDDTTTNHDFTGPFSWTQYFVTGLTPGKRLKRVRIATITDGANYGGIDDVTLTYVPFYSLEGISNGGFETGDLTDWVTGGDHLAWVNTGAYNVHSGTYGCQISVYGGGHYNDAYVEQNLTNSIIYSDFVESFSFWHHVDRVVRVTVTYWDDTTTNHDFTGPFSWTQYYVTGLTPGKRLKRVRIATITDGANYGGIDDVTLIYHHPLLIPDAPILSTISPNPDIDGNIILDWDDVTFTEIYTVYRHSSLITELNGSVTTLGTSVSSTYTDLGVNEGTYYYAITADNVIGTSGISNCESVIVDLPDADAPILHVIVPNPDTDGDITLDWDDVPFADNYTIYRHTSLITELNGSVVTLGTVIPSSYTDLDLLEGTYYYVVTSTNRTGTSDISNCESVVIDLPGPDAPTLAVIVPNPDTDGDITLDWEDVPFADYYTVYRHIYYITELNGSISNLGTTISSTYTDSDLSDGTYFYVVTATNLTGTSVISNCESVEVIIEEPPPEIPGYNLIIFVSSFGVISVLLLIIKQKKK